MNDERGTKDAAGSAFRVLSWHGWSLRLPPDWSPVRIDGDFGRGSIELADLDAPQIALRWETPTARQRHDEAALLTDALSRELGALAAKEATAVGVAGFNASRLYVENDPPGRDVFVGVSATTGRLLQIARPMRRRENGFRREILPTIEDVGDAGTQGAKTWSIFGLRCELPRAMPLARHQLNSGDLLLEFRQRSKTSKPWRPSPPAVVLVRQIAAAKVVLTRAPLQQWLSFQQDAKHYKPARDLTKRAGGMELRVVRRRRFVWRRSLPPALTTHILHDVERDRLIIVQASEDADAGWVLTHRCAFDGKPEG